MLHENKNLFKKLIMETSEYYELSNEIIEKDYYVTMTLKKIINNNPDIVFKGGTSLSKCFKVIRRFSEDIDIGLICDKKASEGQRKKLKRDIISVINDFKFELINSSNIRSRRDFNKYIIDYNSCFNNIKGIKNNLIIETAVFFRIYPYEEKEMSSYIYDFLKQTKREEIIYSEDIDKFIINVQSLERTLIDKCFAIADYYLSDRTTEHSRHIYDIFKLMEIISIDDKLKELAEIVRLERQVNKTCLSASDDVCLNDILSEIIENEIYKEDYEETTRIIMFNDEDISYEQAINGLHKVIDSGLFSRK